MSSSSLATLRKFFCDAIATDFLDMVSCLGISESQLPAGAQPSRWTLPQASRFAHILLVTGVFLFAAILGLADPGAFDGSVGGIDLTTDCDTDYLDVCIYRQLMYRASFAVVIVFAVLAGVGSNLPYLHHSLWLLKKVVLLGLFISLWWADNSVFSVWAQIARHASEFWLVIQALLILDLVYDTHEQIMNTADEKEKAGESSSSVYGLYMSLCVSALAIAIIGVAFLYHDYSDCHLGLVFTSITLIMGVTTTLISLWYPVNRGFLTPCAMFAYCVFKCWYALLSDPADACRNDTSQGLQDLALAVMLLFTIVVVLYCVFNGTNLLNTFDLSQGEGILRSYRTKQSKGLSRVSSSVEPTTGQVYSASEQARSRETGRQQDAEWRSLLQSNSAPEPSSDPPLSFQSSSEAETVGDGAVDFVADTSAERLYFHLLVVLAAFYLPMVLTGWGTTSGAPIDTNLFTEAEAAESLWVKICSQWLFFLLYLRALQVAYQDNLSDQAWADL